ncbi:MAG: hypothetical protein HHJ15_07345 [Rhodoferax sp.]|uniref:hypothetical protein n=1 Tax=Rhodoferax sp. TaxID=50421 RepID=UPI0017ABDEB7|nr:hypothetical protein [Rhodoferax sp.]NMM19744.1 hypothetical protein [Rhodoferax sp.]
MIDSTEDLINNLEDLYGAGCVTPELLKIGRREMARATCKEREEKIKEKFAEETAQGRKVARENNWCALDGTPAQRRWATSIRAELIGKLRNSQAIESAALMGSSTFWIENREISISSLEQHLASEAAKEQIEKTQRRRATRMETAVAKKAQAAAEQRMVKKLSYLLSFQSQLKEVPAAQALGPKFGELVLNDKRYRFFIEGKDLLRVIVGPADGPGQKTNNTLKITSDMHVELATF